MTRGGEGATTPEGERGQRRSQRTARRPRGRKVGEEEAETGHAEWGEARSGTAVSTRIRRRAKRGTAGGAEVTGRGTRGGRTRGASTGGEGQRAIEKEGGVSAGGRRSRGALKRRVRGGMRRAGADCET